MNSMRSKALLLPDVKDMCNYIDNNSGHSVRMGGGGRVFGYGEGGESLSSARRRC